MGCCFSGTDDPTDSALRVTQLRINVWIGMNHKYDHGANQSDGLPAGFVGIRIGASHGQRVSKHILGGLET
jgi:hypothetical protein